MDVRVVVHDKSERVELMCVDEADTDMERLLWFMKAPFPPVFRRDKHHTDEAFEQGRDSAFRLFDYAELVIVTRESIHVFTSNALTSDLERLFELLKGT